MKPAHAFDIHAHITDQIVAAIEEGAPTWEMPWRSSQAALHRPVNVASGALYQGVNILSLWMSAEHQGFSQPIWGTYRQWQAKDAQVRKGEKGTPIVFYKELERDPENDEAESGKRMFARASWVFNAAQVDGFTADEAAPSSMPVEITPHETAERLIRASAADIREGGHRAYYNPAEDYIGMPDRARFLGSATSTPTDAWYATHLHELGHWSGAEHRLNRDMTVRFGSEGYAMEELIAELTSAFLCAQLGLGTASRLDHAAYIAVWLRVLKNDKKAIFTAATQADRAARYLMSFSAPAPHRPAPPDREEGALSRKGCDPS